MRSSYFVIILVLVTTLLCIATYSITKYLMREDDRYEDNSVNREVFSIGLR